MYKQEFEMALTEQEYTDIMGACLWALGRYGWSRLDDYLVGDDKLIENPKFFIRLSRGEALDLYKECAKEFEGHHMYPCASDFLVDIFEEIFQHFDPEGDWAFL